MLDHLVNHHNTQLNAEIKLQIAIFLEFWVVFAVLYFVGNPVSTVHCTLYSLEFWVVFPVSTVHCTLYSYMHFNLFHIETHLCVKLCQKLSIQLFLFKNARNKNVHM